MAGLAPTRDLVGLKVPYGAWEADTLITDTFGNPMFSVLDVEHEAMGAYQAIFGDENGHKLVYVKRRLITLYNRDGWDFCTYKPNFPGQPKYKERDMYGKSVYPFGFLSIRPLKCKYEYSVHRSDMEGMEPLLHAMHGWLGSMTVCCTPTVRFGKWQLDFHRPNCGDPELRIDQSKNLVEVERGNDLLAALCISYAFDKALCQPLVTIVGYKEKEHMDDDDDSLDSYDPRTMGMAAGGGLAANGMPQGRPAREQMQRGGRGGEEDPEDIESARLTRQYTYDPSLYDEDGNYIGNDENFDEDGNYIGPDGQYDAEGNYIAPEGYGQDGEEYYDPNFDAEGNYIGPDGEYDEEGNYGPPANYYDYDAEGNYIGEDAYEDYDEDGNYIGGENIEDLYDEDERPAEVPDII